MIAAAAVDAGHLPLGGGLLALVRPALSALEPGGVLAVIARAPHVADELSSWCRVERHRYLGHEGDQHFIERGALNVPRGGREEWLARGNPHDGFAPRGARVEPGGPSYPYALLDRDRVVAPGVAQLYEQAVSSQWSVDRDIPWRELGEHDPRVEAAVAQVMTFLAENELSALYVPSRFLPRIHPLFAEVAMFLATQMNDEARHVDVFLRRARRSSSTLGISSVTTSRSLLTLMEIEDFTEASFMLSVLGEGTFLDLLRFVEEHAPDACTAEIARRTRVDESRHVHFGMAHVRAALSADPSLYSRLESSVRRRAATLHDLGVPPPLQDALVVLAAGSVDPKAIARGHEAYRGLLDTMHVARIKRLEKAGFTSEQANTLSELHTANFM